MKNAPTKPSDVLAMAALYGIPAAGLCYMVYRVLASL
jgi:hypothetical protein